MLTELKELISPAGLCYVQRGCFDINRGNVHIQAEDGYFLKYPI